jgi:TrmH RNA methyltransferase
MALVLGNEQHGLPRDTRRACDELVTIPGSGSVQSLNVAATTAILIYTLAARCMPGKPDT